MHPKFLMALLIITSLIVYLEWGQGSHTFLFQAEGEVLSKLRTDPASALHPFIVLPLIGQVLLIISLFLKRPSRWMTITGMVCLGVLVVFIFIVGILSRNYRIIASAVPFLLVSFLTLKTVRAKAKQQN